MLWKRQRQQQEKGILKANRFLLGISIHHTQGRRQSDLFTSCYCQLSNKSISHELQHEAKNWYRIDIKTVFEQVWKEPTEKKRKIQIMMKLISFYESREKSQDQDKSRRRWKGTIREFCHDCQWRTWIEKSHSNKKVKTKWKQRHLVKTNKA